MIHPAELKLLREALATLAEGFEDLPAFTPEIDTGAVHAVLQRVAERMQDNYPYFHPQYAGQMLNGSTPITMRLTAVAPAPRSRKSASSSWRACMAGKTRWAILQVAARWQT
jgi:hypothetical protein